ncbi:DNA sulfur modification protein DndE [Aeromonas media]|uniref:DNA sulfur modification protein DndE n=1 Tax=Aeromonas media TaxID=651 RepID=UPI0038D258B9
MIDNIRLSEKAKQQLIVIKRKTGIENWNVLCRWGLCLSLAEESIPPFEDIQTDSSVEMNWKTFSGEINQELKTLILMRFNSEKDKSQNIGIHDFIKLHIHRGISYLFNKVNKNISDLYNW